MGFLFERFGMQIVHETAPGTCPECGAKHPPEMPHDKQKLAYQYHFYDKHGRWPSWADAMAHCSQVVKTVWTEELQSRGEDIEEVTETKIVGLEIKIGEENNA